MFFTGITKNSVNFTKNFFLSIFVKMDGNQVIPNKNA